MPGSGKPHIAYLAFSWLQKTDIYRRNSVETKRMTLGAISGVVSCIKIYNVAGGTTSEGQGSDGAKQFVSFRLNDTNIIFHGSPGISNGDEVAVSGSAQAEFKAFAIRNKTTGAVYKEKAHGEFGWIVLAAAPPAFLFALLWYIGIRFMGLVLVVNFVIILCTMSYFVLHAYRVNRLLTR